MLKVISPVTSVNAIPATQVHSGVFKYVTICSKDLTQLWPAQLKLLITSNFIPWPWGGDRRLGAPQCVGQLLPCPDGKVLWGPLASL